jgi:ornithine--oxo-acid transaminase
MKIGEIAKKFIQL